MPESYSVRLPTGWEGPYTVEELREFLASGKVRSSDRIRRPDGSTTEVSAVLPDAIDISIVRPPPSERIVRKSSDRHAAVARKEASNRLKAVAASAAPPAASLPPAPSPTPGNAPVAGSRSSASDRQPSAAADRKRTNEQRIAAAAPATNRGRGRVAVGIIATLVILVSVGLQLMPSSDVGVQPVNFLGAWEAEDQDAAPQLKGLILSIAGRSIEFDSQTGKRSSTFEVLGVSAGGEQTLSLTPADPDFGEQVRIQPGIGYIRFGTTRGAWIFRAQTTSGGLKPNAAP